MIAPPFSSRQRERLLWQERDQSASDWERSRGFFGVKTGQREPLAYTT
jgi:hypothetical protein